MESVFSFAVLNDDQNKKLVKELNVILEKVGVSLSIKPVDHNSSLLNIQIDNAKFVRITNRFAGRPTYIDDLKQKVLEYLKGPYNYGSFRSVSDTGEDSVSSSETLEA